MLGGLRVLDATGRLGWLAGRLLADLGARVTKLEAPGADLASPHWRALNVNKKVVRGGSERLAGLANDPLGDLDPPLTYAINYLASVRLAELAIHEGDAADREP